MRVIKEITQFYNKLSMKINLLVEFSREKYNPNYKSHIYKIKTVKCTSANTHLKVFTRF